MRFLNCELSSFQVKVKLFKNVFFCKLKHSVVLLSYGKSKVLWKYPQNFCKSFYPYIIHVCFTISLLLEIGVVQFVEIVYFIKSQKQIRIVVVMWEALKTALLCAMCMRFHKKKNILCLRQFQVLFRFGSYFFINWLLLLLLFFFVIFLCFWFVHVQVLLVIYGKASKA